MCIICSRGVLLSVLLVVSFFVVSLPGMFLSLATCDLATTCSLATGLFLVAFLMIIPYIPYQVLYLDNVGCIHDSF